MPHMDVESLRSTLSTHGQQHLLQFWDRLSEKERQMLFADLSLVDFDKVNQCFREAESDLTKPRCCPNDNLEPLQPDLCGSIRWSKPEDIDRYWKIGMREIGYSRVAVLLLAGGRGTRLGVPYPKGMYDVGLPSGKTLYQLQAERIQRLESLASSTTGRPCCIPWYIMTSEYMKEATEGFMDKNNFFGLDVENVVLFEQGHLPSLTFDGKIIMESRSKVVFSPDGNGGLYHALLHNKILDDFEKRGVRHIHVYCVDNILVKMADPVFIGFCIDKGAECGNKVVEKTMPQESVGVVCRVNGLYQVVEYSEISQAAAERTSPDGKLVFNAGNICNHFFTTDFLRKVCRPENEGCLRHHVARKKIPFVDPVTGATIMPTSPNGIKLEKFVFDVFQFARSFAVWDVVRDDEFSPLKNADGAAKDTPTTCREALYSLNRRYAENAGAMFVREVGAPYSGSSRQQNANTNSHSAGDTDEATVCEISPLVSYSGEGLEMLEGVKLRSPVYIELDGDGRTSIRQGSGEGVDSHTSEGVH